MTAIKVGYGRVSTNDQNPSSQQDALAAAGVDKTFIEKFTGTKASRPELDKARATMRRGDVLVVTRLDRLARSTKDLLNMVSEFEGQGIDLVVLEQNIDTKTPEGRLFFTMIAAFAEFEHGILVARTLDGLAAARSRGRVGGRKPKMTTNRAAEAKRLYDAGDKTVKEIADLFGVSRPTVYRALEARI